MKRLCLAMLVVLLSAPLHAQTPWTSAKFDYDFVKILNSTLTTEQIEKLKSSVCSVGADNHDGELCLKSFDDYWIRPIQLSGQQQGFVLKGGWCGATGNCEMTVLDADFHVLINEVGYGFAIIPSTDNGYPDIAFEQRRGMEIGAEFLYQFNGSKYVLQQCAAYDRSEGPEKITFYACTEDNH